MSLPDVECNASLPDVPADQMTVAQAEIVEALSSPRRGVFELMVPSHVDPASLLGVPLRVSLGRTGSDVARRFELLVDDLDDLGATRDGRRLLHVRASSALAELDRSHGTRIWYNATRAEAVAEVLDEAGLYREAAARTLLVDAQRRHEHLTMYDEGHGRFVQRMLEESQCFAVLVDGTDAEDGAPSAPSELLKILSSTRFGEAAATLKTHGGAALALRAHDPTLDCEAVHRIHRRHSQGATSYQARDADFTRPNHKAVMTARADHPAGRGRIEHTWGDGFDLGPYDVAVQQYGLHDGAWRAGAALRASHASDLVLFGTSNVLGLAAHVRGEVSTDDGQTLRMVTTRVRHRFVAPEAKALELVHTALPDTRYQNEFEALPAQVAFAVARTVPRPVAHGLHTAFVVGATKRDDNDVATEHYGRVYVELVYDLRRTSAGQRRAPPSCWLRVASSWAGAGRGLLFPPRVGDEVLVGYFDADPDRPLVVGSLYNAANQWPHPLPDTADRVGIRTLSTPGSDGYSELTVRDDVGHEEVTVRAERDARVLIRNDSSVTVLHDRSESVGRNASLHIEGNASTAVQGSERHQVSGGLDTMVQGRHTIHAVGELTLRSDTRISLSVGGVAFELTPDRATLAVGGGVHAEFRSASQSVEIRGARAVILQSDGNVEAHGAAVILNSPKHSIRDQLRREETSATSEEATPPESAPTPANTPEKKAPPKDVIDALEQWLDAAASFDPLRAGLRALLPSVVADSITEVLVTLAREALVPLLRGDAPDLGALGSALIHGAVTTAVDGVLDAAGVQATVTALQASGDEPTRRQGGLLAALSAEGSTLAVGAAVSGVGVAAALHAGLTEHPSYSFLAANSPEAVGDFLSGAAVAASGDGVRGWCEAKDARWSTLYPTPENPRGAIVSGLPEQTAATAAGSSPAVIAQGHRAGVVGGVRAFVAGGAS